jgi:hypothetical protein
MLRLFSDCIDIRDIDSDGWTVHEWLKRTYARERVPISQNSITWLMHSTANEEYVEISPRALWSGLQHAIRSLLCQERHNRLLEDRILQLSQQEHKATSQSHLNAISLLMAFRVSGRIMLPMALTAGSFLQIKGFDWIHTEVTHREYLQALPILYTAWCHAVLDCAENLEQYVRFEWDECLQQLGCTRGDLLDAMSIQNTAATSGDGYRTAFVCTSCAQDYSALPCALVQPVRVAMVECAYTSHEWNCVCDSTHLPTDSPITATQLPEYAGVCVFSNDDESDSNTDEDEHFYDAEEFYDALPYLTGSLDTAIACNNHSQAFFEDVAALLYRAQGRAWMGEYTSEDRICASCLLQKEHYVDRDGEIADFAPLPEHWDGLRFKW